VRANRWIASSAIALGVLVGVACVTRLPLASPYLVTFDQVNFALSLREFSPPLHQPQPPGYPLFVAFIRLLAIWIANPATVLAVAGVLGSAMAAWLVWKLGNAVGGLRVGWISALLLLLHPVLWFGSLSNPVRTFLAVASCGAAYLCWRALAPQASPVEIGACFCFFGLMAGFRPLACITLSPLLLAVAWRRRWSPAVLLQSAALGLVCALAWLVPLFWASGGPAAYWQLIQEYGSNELAASSAVLGGEPDRARRMLRLAFVWTFFGTLAWVWTVLLGGWRARLTRRTAGFLALWFVPVFVLYAVLHVADPDQTLTAIPPLCLAGGLVIGHFRTVWRISLALLACLASAVLFVYPPRGVAQASSLTTYRNWSDDTREAMETVRGLEGLGPVQLVLVEPHIPWRIFSYYFPGAPVWEIYGERVERVLQGARVSQIDRRVRLAAGGHVVVVTAPHSSQVAPTLQNRTDFRKIGYLWIAPARPGLSLRIGTFAFEIAEI